MKQVAVEFGRSVCGWGTGTSGSPCVAGTFRKSDHVAGPRTDRTLMPSATDSTPCAVIRKRPAEQPLTSRGAESGAESRPARGVLHLVLVDEFAGTEDEPLALQVGVWLFAPLEADLLGAGGVLDAP